MMLVALLCLPLTASAIDTVYINSQDDWEKFCDDYYGYEVNVYLNCDVTLNTKGHQITLFKGMFDGQGHAFIINYKDNKDGDQNKDYYDKNWNADSAPFEYANGTIKNLRLTGTVAIRQGDFAYRMNNPLAEKVRGKLTIENCHCDVAFFITDTGSVLAGSRSSAYVGGFVGCVLDAEEVIFNNCSFTGSFTFTNPNPGENLDYECLGGFVGYTQYVDKGDPAKITFNNCFSHVTYDDRVAVKYFSYFVGYNYNSKISVVNSYGYCVNKKGEKKSLTNVEACTDLTTVSDGAQMISSGELTWKLNGGGTGRLWGQILGTDSVPRLCTHFPYSPDVYHKDETTHQTTANGWTTLCSPFEFQLPEGVTPYVVTGINEIDRTVSVSPYSGSTKDVPLLLYTEGEAQTITLPAGYFNRQYSAGYLQGAYSVTKNSDSYRVLSDGAFVKSESDITAWSCYLSTSGSDSYTIDKSGGTLGSVCLISSNDDWNNLCENHSGQNVTAYLATDLTLTVNDKRITEFIGIFDGQGHCITDNRSQDCLFPKAQGTIKNLRVENNYDARYYMVYFVGGDINFIDCKASCMLWNYNEDKHTINYSHTLEQYYNGTWYAAYGENVDETEKVTDEQLTSGVLTYALNDGRTGDAAVWKQTIGEDDTPQLMSKTSKEVFRAGGTRSGSSKHYWTTLYYPCDVTLPDGVAQYTVRSAESFTAYAVCMLDSTVKAFTPVILYASKGLPDLTLPTVYFNDVPTQKSALLMGVSEETTATESVRTFSESGLFGLFNTDNKTIPAWQCYLNCSDCHTYVIAPSGVLITSKDEWNAFKKQYDGTEVNTWLGTDLTLTDDDAPMTSFKGTFDGQGYTITVNYSRGSTSSYHAPFQQAAGTIKNLQLTGTISVEKNSTVGRLYAAPLVCEVKGSATETVTLNVENCHSSVTFQEDDLGKGLLDAGGFVRQTDVYSTVNFTDCSFTGAFNTPGPLLGVGCFVGNTSSYESIGFTFTNCFSDASGSTFGSIATADGASYLVRSLKSSNPLTVTNCSAVKVGDFNAHTTRCTLNLIDAATAANGSQAYALNAGRTGDDTKWTQTIGTDAVPQLKLFAEDSKEVHEANGGDYQLSTAGWGTLYYPTDVTLDDGVKAYTVSNVEEKSSDGTTENYVVLTAVEGNTLPAYTAAILCSLAEGESTATEKTIPLATFYYNDAKEQSEGDGMTAMLYGVLESTEAPDGSYVMQNQGGKVAFYQVNTNVAQPTIPAYRCVLLWAPKDDQQSSSKINLRFDDEATGINSVVEPLLNDGAVYDLQGRRVQSLQKNQIYIKNGQKFVVK